MVSTIRCGFKQKSFILSKHNRDYDSSSTVLLSLWFAVTDVVSLNAYQAVKDTIKSDTGLLSLN